MFQLDFLGCIRLSIRVREFEAKERVIVQFDSESREETRIWNVAVREGRRACKEYPYAVYVCVAITAHYCSFQTHHSYIYKVVVCGYDD